MTLHHRLCVNPHANISHQTPENDFWGSACRACSSVSILHNQTVSLAAGNTTGYRGKHAAGRVERRFTCRDQVYDGQWEAEDQKHLRKSTGTHLRYVQNRRGFRFSVVEEHQQNMLETKGSLLIKELISIILYIIHSFICALNFVALIQYEKLSAGRLTAGLTVSAARKDDYICKFLWKCIQLKSTWLALFVTQMVHNNCTETFQQGNIWSLPRRKNWRWRHLTFTWKQVRWRSAQVQKYAFILYLQTQTHTICHKSLRIQKVSESAVSKSWSGEPNMNTPSEDRYKARNALN